MTAPYLIIDNTRPIDPTLPDLYDPIDNVEVSPVAVLAAIFVGTLGRSSRMAGWIALGLVVGVFVA